MDGIFWLSKSARGEVLYLVGNRRSGFFRARNLSRKNGYLQSQQHFHGYIRCAIPQGRFRSGICGRTETWRGKSAPEKPRYSSLIHTRLESRSQYIKLACDLWAFAR